MGGWEAELHSYGWMMRGMHLRRPRGADLRGTLLATVLACAGPTLAAPAAAQDVQVPRLAVSIVIDQLRPDLLDRYDEAFTGGLRRLRDQGFRYTLASHAHARTSTAPGHATLTTGVFPARHGVVANTWFQRQGFRYENMYAVADPDSPILGFEDEPLLEGRSPATLLRSGLPDWLARSNPDARRVSISRKDRAAIPMGGQYTEHVYWILPELGRFVTSTHYMKRYPRWLERFNEEVMPPIMSPGIWESEVPERFRDLARADSSDVEGDGVHSTFPHLAVNEMPDTTLMDRYVWGSDQPRTDEAVVALASTVLDELELGQRDELDYLALALSAVDRVGHAYGPTSQEVFSALMVVDRLLGDFFQELDERVGEGRWVVGFTADHGVVTMPEVAREMGVANADRVPRDSVLVRLNEALSAAAQEGGTPPEVAARLAEAVRERGIAEEAYTHRLITVGGAPADSFAVLYRNSYYPGRAWDDLSRFGVDLRYGENDYVGATRGTSHETPYWYDRHVPMVFLGSGVEAGASDEPVYTVDFAPTLAALVGIPIPDDLDGRRVY